MVFVPLRALRMRVRACLAVMRCLDEIPFFKLPHCLFDGVM
jgi:hypothetical protein